MTNACNYLENQEGSHAWQAPYLRFAIETTSWSIFWNLRNATTSDHLFDYKNEDISTPEGVCRMFRRCFSEIAHSAQLQYTFERSILPTITYEPIVQSSTASTPSSLIREKVASSTICKYNFLHELSVCGQSGKPFSCNAGDKCNYKHIPLRGKRVISFLTAWTKLRRLSRNPPTC